MEKPRILIVDDDQNILNFFKRLFRNQDYDMVCLQSGAEALKLIRHSYFDLIITDLKIDRINGIDILKEAKKSIGDVEVVIITGYGTVESAVKAMQLGAYDYITKPLDLAKTRILVHRALERRRLKNQVKQLKKEIGKKFEDLGIIAVSDEMRRVLQLAETIAPTDSTVLITGESGVGKEVLAKYIHKLSRRVERPFVSINCAALPESILESELFGHVKGAFTGAVSGAKGLFEEANGGTVFLDEVGELSLPIQAKLLRVLQEGEVRKVGDVKIYKVDVRIIAATNKNLLSLIKLRRFREDLYYRLNVIPIVIPPLRERKEDIVPLADHFLNIVSKKMGKRVTGFTPEAIYRIKEYEWPGNVRELENMIERLVAISKSSTVTESDVFYVFGMDMGAKNRNAGYIDQDSSHSAIKRYHLINVLSESGWNVQRASRKLGISRTTMWRWMKKYGIKRQKS